MLESMGLAKLDLQFLRSAFCESTMGAGSGSKELTLGAALIDSQGSVHRHSRLSHHPSGIYYPS